FLEPCDAPGRLGRLGGYEILEVIGRGGMGIVLRAMDVKLNRVVAIKVLAPELASQPQARKRFLREAQAAAAVSHDHVVTIHAVDDGEHDKRSVPFLVMECIVGQSLQQKIDKVGALGLKEILRIGMQTAAGLAAAHAQGLVHRDIKPANILLENGVERVKLTDFGLARMVDDASVTQSGVIAGTPQYMSPEQARGEVVDHRSDLFSLGCVLYAMCVGHAPFRASTTMGVLKRVCEDAPRPIREGNADIPDWLAKIIIKLLAKATAHRFQTAREVADLLEQCLAHVQKPSAVSLPAEVRASEDPSPTATADTDDETSSETQSSIVGVCVIAFFVGLVPLFAAGQVSAYPELIPAGLSSRAFAALLRIAAVACWCFIPAIHWWSESRRQKPGGAGETHPGTADSVRSTHPLSPAVPTTAIPPASRSRRLWKWVGLAALVALCVWRFGASLVLTARNVALIRVEMPDPDAKFVLKQNGKEYSEHAPRGEWYVRPGTYEIEIQPRHGRRLERVSYFHQTLMTGHYQPVYSTTPTELYVGRGDYVKLTATFKDAPIDLKLDMNGVRDTSRPSPVEFASDRLAAEWVLSILGTVRVNDVGLDLKTISELPREPFRLTSVDLRENPSVTTAGLSCFAGCRHLSSLSISGSGLTTEGLAHFQNCGNLSSLSLGGPGLTDAGMVHFKDCRRLTSLTLAGQGVTDTGLARFREMPDLSHVILTGTHVTDAGLAVFHSAKLLRQLNLQATDVT
ncbi:MAG: protein kinase, partial [Candidatus Saccharimonas sp.]|nr:protein kinase [Planctomycetaceae bacterium]